MNKKLIIIGISFLMFSCISDFDGIVVCKEYIPAHMDDENPKVIQEASYIPVHPVVVPHRHQPVRVESRFIIYAGNKFGVKKFDVDSLVYEKTKIGQRWSVHY